MKMLVTGATGYVGTHVVEAAHARGHDVTVLLREGDRPPSDGAESEAGDLGDPARMSALSADYDAVVHAAASETPSFAATNRVAVEAMLAGLRAGATFIMPAGSMVFGDTGERTLDGSEPFAPPAALADTAATLSLVTDGRGSS